ncbi:MAG: hypothetical protein SPH77_00670, partial [Campylobacter sp.]|uniref:hypothetical protein n=2 Tax=Campylobacter sp. TaxID=205 RepID=UPI002A919C60
VILRYFGDFMRAFIFALPLVFSACYLNERGISSTYYNDCKAYYDAAGIYHEGCEPNIIEFSDAKKLVNAKKTAVQQELERANQERAKDEAAIDKLEEDFQKEEEAIKRATRVGELANKKEEQNNQEAKDFGE